MQLEDSFPMPGAYVDYVEDEPERPWWGTADQSASWFDAGLSRSPLTGDTEDEDIVIAVMGVTGVGKSTFIKTVSGRNDVITGESLSSETQEIRAYEFFHKGRTYILVDTPGFDDTNRKDTEITQQILTWLQISLLEGTRLNGVIYLHRISDPRMGGTALRNNRMFRKLCGEDVLKNVILATTFWEGVDPAVGASREDELRANSDFWGGMLAKGAKMARLARSKDSALALLDQISTNEKVVLGAQDEMVNQGHSVQETSAMRADNEGLTRTRQRWEAQKEAETAKMLAETEQARVEAATKLAQEREGLRRQRESDRLAEDLRLAREKKEARQRYEKDLQEVRKERQRQEQRQRDEKAAMARKEREERERQEAREQAAAVEVVRQRTQYQSNYVCIQAEPRWPCDHCKGKVQRYAHYYHCHFCDSDRYFHCGACGNDCGDATHPVMVQRESKDDCIVM